MPVLYMERSALEGLTEADIKKIIEENEGSIKYQRLEGYYVGDHDILRYTKKDKAVPNNRLVNNMPRYITDTAVGYFLGKADMGDFGGYDALAHALQQAQAPEQAQQLPPAQQQGVADA